jgi:hypothetical protein
MSTEWSDVSEPNFSSHDDPVHFEGQKSFGPEENSIIRGQFYFDGEATLSGEQTLAIASVIRAALISDGWTIDIGIWQETAVRRTVEDV